MNVKSSFKELREDREFADVTLVCQDGKQLEVHKNILAFSSPLFLGIFRTRKHPHPLLYLTGIRSDILVSVLDFIYCGEATVLENDIEAFFAVADELKLKGLTTMKEFYQNDLPAVDKEYINESGSQRKIPQKVQKGLDGPRKEQVSAKISAQGGDLMFKYVETDEETDKGTTNPIAGTVPQGNFESAEHAISTQSEPGEVDDFIPDEIKLGKMIKDETIYSDLQEMDEQINSLISKSNVFLTGAGREGRRASKCNLCGKLGMKSVIINHIEAHHINTIRRECDICEKSFKTRNALASHKATRHKGHFIYE